MFTYRIKSQLNYAIMIFEKLKDNDEQKKEREGVCIYLCMHKNNTIINIVLSI